MNQYVVRVINQYAVHPPPCQWTLSAFQIEIAWNFSDIA